MPVTSWLILLYSLPASQAAARLSLWRQLKRLGAVSLKTSAYILPQRPEHEESLQWLAQRIRQEGGEATLLRSAEVDTLSPNDVIEVFQAARAEDYEAILGDALALGRTKGKRDHRFDRDPAVEAEKLRKRFLTVKQIDFFGCPAAEKVKQTLDALVPTKPFSKRSPTVKRADFQGKVWQTRPRPELDRVASAWLISRFIDVKATFVFASERLDGKKRVTFDMVDADFGHEGEDCTFETLLRRFSLKTNGLTELAEVVHAADIADGKYARHEGEGLLAVLRGWARHNVADEEILRRGFELMDGLWGSLVKN
jgi:hypothetical protein